MTKRKYKHVPESMTIVCGQPTISPTRYKELGYSNHDVRLWRVIDLNTNCAVGPKYVSKAELLADLDRYAKVFGCA